MTTIGNFSISLAVKNLETSRTFYQQLGFEAVGPSGKNFLILQNKDVTIGLFQGMFERNILTFNPGWDRSCNKLPEFTDVREWERRLRAQGIEPVTPVDAAVQQGPGSFIVVDPDGNPILVDQHV